MEKGRELIKGMQKQVTGTHPNGDLWGAVQSTPPKLDINPQSPLIHWLINAISMSLFSAPLSPPLFSSILLSKPMGSQLFILTQCHISSYPPTSKLITPWEAFCDSSPVSRPNLVPVWLGTATQTPATECYFSLLLEWHNTACYIKAKRFDLIFPFCPTLTPDNQIYLMPFVGSAPSGWALALSGHTVPFAVYFLKVSHICPL